MTGKISPRYSRHYYDLAQWHGTKVKQIALSNLKLLEEFINFKQRFYKQTKARYDLAVPGTFKLFLLMIVCRNSCGLC